MRPQITAATSKAFYIVVDFEATCWDDTGRRGDNEIIEIGCVRVRRRDGAVDDVFETLVQPTRYPVLSNLCRVVTGIDQADIDTAPRFPQAYRRMREWIGDPHAHAFASWGAYDRFLLRSTCAFHRLPFPFDDEYINIKPAFVDRFMGRGVSMEQALAIVGAPPTMVRHRALSDARSAAILLREVLFG